MTALAVPEIAGRRLDALVKRIGRAVAGSGRLEVKLKELAEAEYFAFLADAEKLGVVLFCTTTDAGRITPQEIISTNSSRLAEFSSTLTR